MSLRAAILLAGVIGCLLAPAEGSAETEFHFADFHNNSTDLFLWPVNLHLGGGVALDSSRGTAALSVGVDVARFSYKSLVVDTVSLRLLIRSNCGNGQDCGFGADFFVGPRAFYAAYLSDNRDHRLLVGGGLGWGSVGSGFAKRPGSDDGQLLATAAVGYEFVGLIGIEVAVLLPVTNMGEPYPAAFTVNVLGLGALLLALAN